MLKSDGIAVNGLNHLSSFQRSPEIFGSNISHPCGTRAVDFATTSLSDRGPMTVSTYTPNTENYSLWTVQTEFEHLDARHKLRIVDANVFPICKNEKRAARAPMSVMAHYKIDRSPNIMFGDRFSTTSVLQP